MRGIQPDTISCNSVALLQCEQSYLFSFIEL